jgi:hypothetical protein
MIGKKKSQNPAPLLLLLQLEGEKGNASHA